MRRRACTSWSGRSPDDIELYYIFRDYFHVRAFGCSTFVGGGRRCPDDLELYYIFRDYVHVRARPGQSDDLELYYIFRDFSPSGTLTSGVNDEPVWDYLYGRCGTHDAEEGAELSATEKKVLSSVVGQLNWAARQCRYDLAYVS